MAAKCPACNKSLQGQVNMCPLCGEAYHKKCLEGSWDCVYCTTQIKKGQKIRGKSTSPIVYALLLFALLAGAIFWMYHTTMTPIPLQTGKGEAALIEANQQLDLIRIAILQYERKNGPLYGISLSPLMGGYLSSIPTDPWGNSYIYDGNIGVIVSPGSDGKPGGTGTASDILCYFRKRLTLSSATYSTATGQLTLTFNKPFAIGNESALFTELLIADNNGQMTPLGSNWKLISTDRNNLIFQYNHTGNSPFTEDAPYFINLANTPLTSISCNASVKEASYSRRPMAIPVSLNDNAVVFGCKILRK